MKRLFDQHGNRKNRHPARLRFLWKSLGEDRFRELYKERLQRVRSENPPALLLEPVPNFSTPPPFEAEVDDSPEFEQWAERFVEAQKQPGLVSVLVPIFLGNLNNNKAIRLADFLAPFGDHAHQGYVWPESQAAESSGELSPKCLPPGARTHGACIRPA